MPIFHDASVQDIKRLLELFPISRLKQAWPDIKGTKDEICYAIADGRDTDAISDFIDKNLSGCKQHVYVFSRPTDLTELPDSIGDGERILNKDDLRALFLIRVRYNVLLRDPLEEAYIEFLWPVRLDITDNNVVVRFVVLQKNMGAYFDRSHYVAGRTSEEEDVIAAIAKKYDLSVADLHKGIKKLWDEGFMDSPRAQYKKPISTASEAMDEEKGIREHNPELYETLCESPLFRTMFVISPGHGGTEVFFVDPSKGYLVFPRYSDETGDTDFVISEILRRNQ